MHSETPDFDSIPRNAIETFWKLSVFKTLQKIRNWSGKTSHNGNHFPLTVKNGKKKSCKLKLGRYWVNEYLNIYLQCMFIAIIKIYFILGERKCYFIEGSLKKKKSFFNNPIYFQYCQVYQTQITDYCTESYSTNPWLTHRATLLQCNPSVKIWLILK